MEDWYNVSKGDITIHGGEVLLSYCGGSPSKALRSIYPEHNWILERFKRKPAQLWSTNDAQRRLFLKDIAHEGLEDIPMEFWKSRDNQTQFFDWLKDQLGFLTMEDWYNVRKEDIDKNGGAGLLVYHFGGSPSKALQSVYPEHHWEMGRF